MINYLVQNLSKYKHNDGHRFLFSSSFGNILVTRLIAKIGANDFDTTPFPFLVDATMGNN